MADTKRAPPVCAIAFPSATFASSFLQRLIGTNLNELLGHDRFLARGRSMHLRYQSALLVKDVLPRLVQGATAALCEFDEALGKSARRDYAWVRASPTLMGNLHAFSSRHGAYARELTGRLDPDAACASQVLFALLEREVPRLPVTPLELSNALEFALWAEGRFEERLRASCPVGAAGVEEWFAGLTVEYGGGLDAALRAYAGFKRSQMPADPAELNLAWGVTGELRRIDAALVPADHPARAWLAARNDVHSMGREALSLVRVLAALLEKENRTQPWALRMRALSEYGFALDVSYMQTHASNFAKGVIQESETLLADIWQRRVRDGQTLQAAAQALMHAGLDAASHTLFTDFFSLPRVASMTATAAAALVCELQLAQLAGAHAPSTVRATLWMLYPLIATVLQRAQDAAGLWPRFRLSTSATRGLFIAGASRAATRRPSASRGASACRGRR